MPERPSSDVEVEWQLDALDLRPVERWLSTLAGPPDGGAPAPTALAVTASRGSDGSAEAAGQSAEAGPAADGDVFTAVPKPAVRLVDTYLDTADWRIGRSGHVLRIRQRAGQGQVTLKDTAPAKSGLRRRLEVSEPLPVGGVAALGPSGPVGRRVWALAGKRRLQPVLEVRTRRRPYDLRRGALAVAEVALDDTTIVVGTDHQPVRLQRVEVEVEPAWVEALAPLVDTMRRECGLQAATLSKFEAGLLAAGVRVPPPADLGTTTLSPNPSVGQVAFAVLRRNFAVMLAHESGTRLGEDAEELHDMRVATRRMRAALSLFSDALPVRARHIRSELGWLADVLGTVRDLDVQLERLTQWLDEVPDEDRGALDDLARVLHAERDQGRGELLAALESVRYERLVASFTTMLRQGPSRRSPAIRVPALSVVPGLIDDRHRSATKAARRAKHSGAPADFHRLRISCKRLRYALEFVSEIYDGHTTRYVRHVVKLQDALGLMQDARVAAVRLHALVTAEGEALSPTTVFVMGGIAERYRRESAQLAKKIPGLLKELRGPEWRRLVSLMEHQRLEAGAIVPWPVGVRAAGPSHLSGAATTAPIGQARRSPRVERVPPVPVPAAPPEDAPALWVGGPGDREAPAGTAPGTAPGAALGSERAPEVPPEPGHAVGVMVPPADEATGGAPIPTLNHPSRMPPAVTAPGPDAPGPASAAGSPGAGPPGAEPPGAEPPGAQPPGDGPTSVASAAQPEQPGPESANGGTPHADDA